MAGYKGINGYTAAESLGLANGQGGFDRIADTTTHTEDYFAILVVDSATFDAGTTVESGDTPNGDTITPGTIIYGPFTAVQLSAGTVYAYKR